MAQQQEVAPATSPSKKAKSAAKKSGGKKKNQPGRYSQLVVDTIRSLGERSGSSLAKIYGEAKKVPWFDQQNGRTYLKYSVRALVQNDTLLQVKGQGANGSFRLNKKKLEGLAVPPRKKPAGPPKPAAKKKPAAAAPQKKGTPKKAKPAPKKKSSKSPKKASGSRAPPGKAKKASKPKGLKAKKA